MASITGRLKGLLKVELAGNILSDALADVHAGDGHVRTHGVVLPRHSPASLGRIRGRDGVGFARGERNPRKNLSRVLRGEKEDLGPIGTVGNDV